MDNFPGNALGSASVGTEERPFSVGGVLREAREQLGLSVADVKNRLKFASSQIEALEADNFACLPEISFVRRFVRSYAKLLQLDPAPLLASLPIAPSQAAPHAASIAIEVPFPNIHTTRRFNIIWLVAGLAVVAIALVLFAWLNPSEPITPQATVETLDLPAVISAPASVIIAIPPQPEVAVLPLEALAVPVLGMAMDVPPKDGNLPAPAKVIQTESKSVSKRSGSIQLTFDAESWVKVMDNDGKILLSQLNSSGSEQHLKGRPPFSVVIGNASGVRLYYQGKLVELAPYYHGGIARLTLE